ncbi:hypothetical protein HHI36_017036, partial [Cryptolaemus montrouzieri]
MLENWTGNVLVGKSCDKLENKRERKCSMHFRNLVKYEEKQRSYVKNESRRKESFQYRLQTGNDKMK